MEEKPALESELTSIEKHLGARTENSEAEVPELVQGFRSSSCHHPTRAEEKPAPSWRSTAHFSFI